METDSPKHTDLMAYNHVEATVTVAEVAKEVAKPPAPREYTRKELGQLRRQYVTIVHGTVKACGHKDNFSKTERREGKQPSNNCMECWKAYFMTSVDLEGVHVVLTKQGVRALIAQRGKKFAKMFHGFLSACLLPALAAEINNKEIPAGVPAKIEGGTFANGNIGQEVQDPSVTQ